MKYFNLKTITLFGLLFVAMNAFALDYKSQKAKLSYTLGYQMGSSLKQQQLDEYINISSFRTGMQDAVTGGKLKVNEADMNLAVDAIRNKMMERMKQQKGATDNAKTKTKKNNKAEFKTAEGRFSYTVGYRMGSNMKNQQIHTHIDAKVIAQAVDDVLSGAKLKVETADMQSALGELEKIMLEKARKVANENKTKGDAYRAKNKKRKGVKELPNGIQYEVLKDAKGTKPNKTDIVEVHYLGTLIDGSEFDSSIKRGQTISFPLTGVIKGWQEILPMMPTGSKWKVVIPPELAYGPRGTSSIGPNQTLIFEIELVSIDTALSDGIAYREKNKQRQGVKELPSGVQYEILQDAQGQKPQMTDSVTIHYRGTLVDGKEFDSTLKRAPAKFPLSGVINGWKEILPMMSVGSKWKVVVPPQMAMGQHGEAIGGQNQTLIFEIELISIN